MSVNSWLSKLFRSSKRRPSRRPEPRQGKRRLRPTFELLEDRITPATFGELGATLNLDLNVANEAISIVSGGTSYTLTLNAGNTWSGTDSANVTGNGSATLTVTDAGLSAFNAVNLTDSNTSSAVTFADSGANAYGDAFTVTLDNSPGVVTFSGASRFDANDLTVTTARNILVTSGAVVQTSTGDLTFSANQQATPTAGNFVGVDDATGSQFGVYLRNAGTVQGGTGAVTITGTGGHSSGAFNDGVRMIGTN